MIQLFLIRNALNRCILYTRHISCELLDLLLGTLGIIYPIAVEFKLALRLAELVFLGIDRAGIASVQELVKMVLGLPVLAGITDRRNGKLCVLIAVFLSSADTECSAVKTDQRGMTEVGIDTVISRSVCNRCIYIVAPRQY